jgi:hypothetical protein
MQLFHLHVPTTFMGNTFIFLDAHSKWGEAIQIQTTTTAFETTAVLRNISACYELPMQFVSDNVDSL